MSIFTNLKLEKIEAGTYKGKPFYGVACMIAKTDNGAWIALVTVDDNPVDSRAERFPTRAKACEWVNEFGNGRVVLKNALSGKSFLQTRRMARRPGVCPSMESYFSM